MEELELTEDTTTQNDLKHISRVVEIPPKPPTFEENVLPELRGLIKKGIQAGKFSPDIENVKINFITPKGDKIALLYERDPIDFIEEIKTFFDSNPDKLQRLKFFAYLSKIINLVEYQEIIIEEVGTLIGKVIMNVNKKDFNNIVTGCIKHKMLKSYLFDMFSMSIAKIDEMVQNKKDETVDI